jgi:uncharacterized protein
MTRIRVLVGCLVLVLSAVVLPPFADEPVGAQGRPAGQAGEPARRGRGGAERARPRKLVLAWADTRNGQAQHESTSHALSVIERLGYESGAYDTFIRTDSHIVSKTPLKTTGEAASGGPSLASVDEIFFLGHRDVPIDDKQKNELLTFVRDEGKGFVAAHTALTAFDTWPAFGDLLGGRYDGHPWGSTAGTVVNEAPDFPATRHFPESFAFTDEFYQAKEFSRLNARVLLRLDVSKMPPSDGYHGKNGDMPIVWAKTYGKGRVFYSSLGHSASTWDNRDVGLMYLEAIKWALGMTEGSTAPRAWPTNQ